MNWRHLKLDTNHLVCLSCKKWEMTGIYQGIKKHYQQSHGKTLHSKASHRIHSLTCLDSRPPILKERTVFALVTPFCCSLLSSTFCLSGPLQFPVLPPNFPSQGSWTKAAIQTTLLCCLSDSHRLQLHKGQDPLPCCCRLWQASCGANSKLSLHRNSPLESLLVLRPAYPLPVRGVRS